MCNFTCNIQISDWPQRIAQIASPPAAHLHSSFRKKKCNDEGQLANILPFKNFNISTFTSPTFPHSVALVCLLLTAAPAFQLMEELMKLLMLKQIMELVSYAAFMYFIFRSESV